MRGALTGNERLRALAAAWFTRMYYYYGEIHGETWKALTWRNVPVQKFPTDLWLHQELIMSVQPDLIIETGTLHGGSALYFASLLDLLGRGEVVSVDIGPRLPLPEHPRITYITGSSVAPDVIAAVEQHVARASVVYVILDSDHSEQHVYRELELYSRFVTPGSYLVVEDGTVNRHPVLPEFGPGPLEAQRRWLPGQSEFAVDPVSDKYLVTNNPQGVLRRAVTGTAPAPR